MGPEGNADEKQAENCQKILTESGKRICDLLQIGDAEIEQDQTADVPVFARRFCLNLNMKMILNLFADGGSFASGGHFAEYPQQGFCAGKPADDPAAIVKVDLAAIAPVDMCDGFGEAGNFAVLEDPQLQFLLPGLSHFAGGFVINSLPYFCRISR